MASYPNYPQLDGSKEEWLDDRRVERSAAGNMRGRSFYTVKKRRFVLSHDLTDAELATFETFYDTNRDLVVTFTWCRRPGETYECVFERAPDLTLILPNTRIVVVLGEV